MKINTLLFIFIILSTKLLASNYALHEPVANMVFDEIFQYFDTAMQNKIGDELYGEISRSNFENKFKEGSHYPDDNDSENRHSHLASLIFDSTNAVQTDLNRYFNNMFWVFGVACHILEDLSCDLFWQGTLAQEYAYGDVSSFSYLTWRYNYDVIKPFNNVENFIDNHGWQAYLIRILSEKEESPKILDNTILSYSNASEKGLFEDVYKGNPSTGGAGAECFTKFWHFEDKYEYKTPKLYNWSDDYVLITEAIKNLIDAMVNNYKDGKFSIEYKDIPSIFFLDNGYSDNSETSETEAGKEYTFEKAHNEEFKFLNIKTPWLGQSSNARTECIKKSLISQLFDVKMQEYYFKYKNIYSLNQSLTNNYISLPEINVYKIDYMFFTDTSANGDLTYFKLGGVYGHKYQSYDDNFLSDKLCIGFNVSLYSVIGTKLKLKNLLSDKGVNCQNDSITIFTKLYGLNIYGNRTLLDSMPFKVSIHALSIEALACNNRPNLLYVVSKDHFISNYSVYIDLAIKMSDGQNKTFYTMNMNDFYENQILDFAAKRYNYDNDELSTYEGKRYKMQMLCTTYPVIETGLYQYIFDPEIGDLSIFQPDYRRLYSDLSSKSLINLSYQFPTGGMFVDCVQKPGDDNQVGYIRIFCPNGLKQMINNDELSTQKDNLYVYTMKSKKIEIVKLSEFINNIEYLNENDTIIFVTKGNQIQNQSKFSDFVSDIGSNIYSEVYFDDDNNISQSDWALIWVYTGVVETVDGKKIIKKLQEDVKRFGEGVAYVTFEDKSSPSVSVKAPSRNLITNEFGSITDSLPISITLSDISQIGIVKLSLFNSKGEAVGNFRIDGKTYNDYYEETFNQTSVDIVGKFGFKEYPAEEGKYTLNIYSEDKAIIPNKGNYKQVFYVDRTWPDVTSPSVLETLRVSQSKSDAFNIELIIEDNLDNYFASMNEVRYYMYKSDNEIMNCQSDNIYYGDIYHSIPIKETYEDGNYNVDIKVQDKALNAAKYYIKTVQLDKTPPEIVFLDGITGPLLISSKNENYIFRYQTNEITTGEYLITNGIDTFKFYDEGNTKDENYVRGETDILEYTLNASEMTFYPDGKYNVIFKYQDDLGNDSIYRDLPLIIDRKPPLALKLIPDPFVCSSGSIIRIKFTISEEEDNDNNIGKVKYWIYKESINLCKDSVTLTPERFIYNVNKSYQIGLDENGRQSLRIELEDQHGNRTISYVNYIVNTLGAMIIEPTKGSILSQGIYTIKGIAGDPDITNSNPFAFYRLYYKYNDEKFSDNLLVPCNLMGDSVNISQYPMNSIDVLGFINLGGIYAQGRNNVKLFLETNETGTNKTLSDSVFINIDGSMVGNPIISEYFLSAATVKDQPIEIKYNIEDASSEVRLTVLDENDNLITSMQCENYYCFDKTPNKSDNSKVYIYEDTDGSYVIESMENTGIIEVALSGTKILSTTGSVVEINGLYRINSSSSIKFTNKVVSDFELPIIIETKDYNLCMVDDNTISRDEVMIFNGRRAVEYSCVNNQGNKIEPGEYKIILEVNGFNGGYAKDEKSFTKKSELEITATANPTEINPNEPGMESSIITIESNENANIDFILYTPEGKAQSILANYEIISSSNYTYKFEGMFDGIIKEGLWTAEVKYRSKDNTIIDSTFIQINVKSEAVTILEDKLYIPENYIRGIYQAKDVVNAEPIYEFNYKPEGWAKYPIPYKIDLYTSGSKYFDGVKLSYQQSICETPKSSDRYYTLDSSHGLICTNDDTTKGVIKIHKQKYRDIIVDYKMNKYDDGEYLNVLYYNAEGDSTKYIATWESTGSPEPACSGQFIITEDVENVDIVANVDIITSANIDIEVSVRFDDNILDTIYNNKTNSCSNTENFVLNLAGSKYPNDFVMNYYPLSGYLSNRISEIQYVSGSNGEEYLITYDQVDQPMQKNYVYYFRIEGINNNLYCDFPQYISAGYEMEESTVINSDNGQFSIVYETKNVATLYNNEHKFNKINTIEEIEDSLLINQYTHNYENHIILLDNNVILLENDTRVFPNSITLDSVKVYGKVNYTDFVLNDTSIISPKNESGSNWVYNEDTYFNPDIKYFSELYKSYNMREFPSKGIGEEMIFADYYNLIPLQVTANFEYGPLDTIFEFDTLGCYRFDEIKLTTATDIYFDDSLNAHSIKVNNSVNEMLDSVKLIYNNSNNTSKIDATLWRNDNKLVLTQGARGIIKPTYIINAYTTEEVCSNSVYLSYTYNSSSSSCTLTLTNDKYNKILNSTKNTLIISGTLTDGLNNEVDFSGITELSELIGVNGYSISVNQKVSVNIYFNEKTRTLSFVAEGLNYGQKINLTAVWNVQNTEVISFDTDINSDVDSVVINVEFSSEDSAYVSKKLGFEAKRKIKLSILMLHTAFQIRLINYKMAMNQIIILLC